MSNIVNTGNEAVDALADMNISGNVIPAKWYKNILQDNGKPYLLAICILSEIVYWYRPAEIRDEHTGMLIGYRKKFREDSLQKSYSDFATQFGKSKISVKDAIDRLEEIGVIRREFVSKIMENGMVLNNIMYIHLLVDRLYVFTFMEDSCPKTTLDNTEKSDWTRKLSSV